MSKVLKWFVVPAVLALGLLCFAPSSANAQGFSIRIGGGGYYGGGGGYYGGGGGYYGNYGNYGRSNVSFYYGPSYPTYYRYPAYSYRPVTPYYYRAPAYRGRYCW